MWSKEVSIKTTASKERIWKIWSDVPAWKTWDDQVQDSSLKGLFQQGGEGVLKPTSGPKSTFQLIEVTEGQSFTSRAKLPLAQMDFIHTLAQSNGELILTHRIEISGLLTFLFSRVIGNKLLSELPKALTKLAQMAEIK